MLTKPVDSLTAPLLKAAETRKPIKSLAVDMTTPGATLRYSLESVIIEDISYSLYSNDPGGGIQGQETVNLSAAKMTVAFVKGSQHSTVTLDKPKHAP
jgi:type VI protein secretion system component Hcp